MRRPARRPTPRAPRGPPPRPRVRRPRRTRPPPGTPRMAATAPSRSDATVTPFPAASPSALTTARPPSSSTKADARLDRGERRRPGRRDPVPHHQVLREGLRSLEAGGCASRAEGPPPSRPELVREPGDERRLRADHDEVGVQLVRQPELRTDVVGGGAHGTSRPTRSRRFPARRGAARPTGSAPTPSRGRAPGRRRRRRGPSSARLICSSS